MKKLPVGQVFSLVKVNEPIPGCTVSEQLWQGRGADVCVFSLAAHTDISAELFPADKFLFVLSGSPQAAGRYTPRLGPGGCVLLPAGEPAGVRAAENAVYLEWNLRRPNKMNQEIKAGEVFRLGELAPYREGKIVNMDVLSNENMKFVVMSFDAGTALSEHAAPGEALLFALDGEAVIGYEGREQILRAGENFHFAKGGLHSVKAASRFKMALLLTLA